MALVITVRTEAVPDSSHEELRLELELATDLEWTVRQADEAGTLGSTAFVLSVVAGSFVSGAAEEMTKHLIEIVRSRVEEWRNQFVDRPPIEKIEVTDTESGQLSTYDLDAVRPAGAAEDKAEAKVAQRLAAGDPDSAAADSGR
jgi:hypothetical protein